jgi:hypothetical protein
MTRSALHRAVLSLALLWGAGVAHALSLRSSAAELFLGDVSPGASVVCSHATGSCLHLENAGSEPLRVDVKAVAPPLAELRDGFETWPAPGRIRLAPTQAALRPGEAAQVEISVPVPKDKALVGGQYEFDVLATASDRGGSSLTLRTQMLLSVGAPLAPPGDVPEEVRAERPGFSLAPEGATLEKIPLGRAGKSPGGGTTVKIVNAGDEDVTVTLSPAREWDDATRRRIGKFPPSPDPRWLSVEPAVVKVRAGAIGSARLEVSVPRERRYAGRRWAFVAAVDAAAHGRRTRRYYVLNVSTQDWEEETQAR